MSEVAVRSTGYDGRYPISNGQGGKTGGCEAAGDYAGRNSKCVRGWGRDKRHRCKEKRESMAEADEKRQKVCVKSVPSQ